MSSRPRRAPAGASVAIPGCEATSKTSGERGAVGKLTPRVYRDGKPVTAPLPPKLTPKERERQTRDAQHNRILRALRRVPPHVAAATGELLALGEIAVVCERIAADSRPTQTERELAKIVMWLV